MVLRRIVVEKRDFGLRLTSTSHLINMLIVEMHVLDAHRGCDLLVR